MEPIFRRDRDGWTFRLDWRIVFPIFVVLFTLCSDARAEMLCAPCVGFTTDIALDSDFILTCVPGGDPKATGIELEAAYEDGGITILDGGTDCRALVALFEWNRVQIRGRYYEATRRGEWGLPSARAHRLVPFEDQCLGDLDHNGLVDGDDFTLFRGAFIDGCE